MRWQWARACGLPHAASSDAHEPAAIGTCVSSVPAAAVDGGVAAGAAARGHDVDRRPPAAVALARKAAGRTGTALRVLAGREPLRRRR